jgi:glycosyltransferase involved in cell wall biosynthesis
MDVSVVIPTRDRSELLALTLHSVLWQEAVEAEVLVVDDGVGPGTTAVVGGLRDARLHLLRNTGPAGVSGARNSGIAAAKGEWIAFLDDDDLWAPGKLRTQLTAARAARAGWVYAGHVTVDEELRLRGGAPPPPPAQVVQALQHHNAVPAGASNVVVRRDVIETAGMFDPRLGSSEDWDLWLRLARTGLPACVPRPMVALRMHARMASRAVDHMLADIETIAARHGIPVDRARHQRWAAWMCLEDGCRGAAVRHYARAVARGDIVSLGRAIVALVDSRIARPGALPPNDGWAREAQAWLQRLRVAGSFADRADEVL